jgi:hypothetical protein
VKKSAYEIIGKTNRYLDQRQRARLKDMGVLERLLVVRLISELTQDLEEGPDGRIKSRRGSVRIGKTIDDIFKGVEEEGLPSLMGKMVVDMRGTLDFNAKYYQKLTSPNPDSYADIRKAVDAVMRRRLGLDPEYKVNPKGYLGELGRNKKAREEVKKLVAKAVAAGVPMAKLKKALAVKVAGTKRTPGVIERNLGGFVLDAYQVADAVTNREFAKRLDLKYFIYSGGLIETSREFCRKRNGQVFTTEEAEKWDEDATLPKTKEERDSGVVADYNPLEDRGRWNCRHRILYIPEEEAFRRRPDLRKG